MTTMRIVLPSTGLLMLLMGAAACSTASEPPITNDTGLAALSADAQTALNPDADLLVPVQHVIEALDSGLSLTFVDARPALDYEFGHIPGAVNIPYYDAASHLETLDPDALYIVYCECPHAEAVQLADEMIAAGFNNVKVIDEGLYGWTQAGGETVSGTAAPPTGGA